MPKNHLLKYHLPALIIFNCALFMPMMGRGLIHDDFMHLYLAASQSVRDGLANSFVKNFYTPLAWLTFKLDWLLWRGEHPYPLAAVNLALHTANVLLLHRLAWRLWRSSTAAWWAAFGFALLFPANTWAVMWIATRAHLIATFFYLAAMLAALWFARTERRKPLAAFAVVCFAALSMFAKESGVTVVAAVTVLLIYENRLSGRSVPVKRLVILFVALLAALGFYLVMRERAGALAPSVSGGQWYSYVLSPRVLVENLARYVWRTYGILAIIGGAICASQIIRGLRPRLTTLSKYDLLFSFLLFLSSVAPFVLLPGRSGIYTYLPGGGAALLLGAAAQALYQPQGKVVPRRVPLALLPILLAVVACVGFTIGHSLKWMQMATMTSTVLKQIAAEQPQVKPNTSIILTYSEADRRHRFLEGFAEWGFPFAVKLLYKDSSVDGIIAREGGAEETGDKAQKIYFTYTVGNNAPKIVRTSSEDARAKDDE